MAAWSQYLAASGHCSASELQAQTAFPDGNGEPAFWPQRLFGAACHLWSRARGHSVSLRQCTFLVDMSVISSGDQPSHRFDSQSHSASRCGAPTLMLGCRSLGRRRACCAHSGHPLLCWVLSDIVEFHLLLQRPHFQAAGLLLLPATASGVLLPLASQSHSFATSG